MFPASAKIFIAEVADGLVSALILILFLFYLIRDDVDLVKIQRGVHNLLIVFEDLFFPVIRIRLA